MQIDFEPTAAEIMHAISTLIIVLGSHLPSPLAHQVSGELSRLADEVQRKDSARIGTLAKALALAVVTAHVPQHHQS